MTYPRGQEKPGPQALAGADAPKPAGQEPRDLATDARSATSTHYPDKAAPDAAKPGGRNGDGVGQNRRGYRSTDQDGLPSTRDTTGGRIRRIGNGT